MQGRVPYDEEAGCLGMTCLNLSWPYIPRGNQDWSSES